MADVALERVTKHYGGPAPALADVDLAVADGELLVVVGPSGCGKSTLLRLVAGLEQATSGTLRIGGRPVNDTSPQERNVAMVFQDYALYPHLSARRNLEFPLRMRRMPRDQRRMQVERIAELLGLGALLERLPRELSGGQRQRVAMGRALVREPAVFLLDEPLSNLDPQLRLTVRAELKALQRQTRTTMLYVTHDQVEAMTLADRVAVLDVGRLQQVAPPRELYDEPANVMVAGFIGNPPMSLFPAVVDARDGRPVLRTGGHTLPLPSGVDPSPGTTVTAGVRPEALRIGRDAAAGLSARVEQLENLGHETLVHVRLDGDEPVRLIARVDGMPLLEAGATPTLMVDPSGVYLFGADGRRLGAR
jgi:ABC-type sugar transport system ATPase subunit